MFSKMLQHLQQDDDSYEFTDESDDVDPDGELGRIAWIERTKKCVFFLFFFAS